LTKWSKNLFFEPSQPIKHDISSILIKKQSKSRFYYKKIKGDNIIALFNQSLTD